MRGSMFSLFSSSQLVYARCRGKALVFRRPGLPAFCGAHFLAASWPHFHLRHALGRHVEGARAHGVGQAL